MTALELEHGFERFGAGPARDANVTDALAVLLARPVYHDGSGEVIGWFANNWIDVDQLEGRRAEARAVLADAGLPTMPFAAAPPTPDRVLTAEVLPVANTADGQQGAVLRSDLDRQDERIEASTDLRAALGDDAYLKAAAVLEAVPVRAPDGVQVGWFSTSFISLSDFPGAWYEARHVADQRLRDLDPGS